MPRFAIDEQFPETILESLGLGIPEAELVPVREIDRRLCGLDDWELLLEIYRRQEWDGLITADGSMLLQPREVSMIHQTNLTVVVVDSAGHDPIRAAGLLLVHLPSICRKTVRNTGQVWKLAATSKGHDRPWDLLAKIAEHSNASVDDLFRAHKLTRRQLREGTASQQRFRPT